MSSPRHIRFWEFICALSLTAAAAILLLDRYGQYIGLDESTQKNLETVLLVEDIRAGASIVIAWIVINWLRLSGFFGSGELIAIGSGLLGLLALFRRGVGGNLFLRAVHGIMAVLATAMAVTVCVVIIVVAHHAPPPNQMASSPQSTTPVPELPPTPAPTSRPPPRLAEFISPRRLLDYPEPWGYTFSPDGKIFAGIDHDKGKLIKLWDVASGQLLQTLSGQQDEIKAVAISPDGQTVAAGGLDRTINLWNAVSGQQLRTLAPRTGDIRVIAFSPPDGRTLATGGYKGIVTLWDVASGRLLHTLTGDDGDEMSCMVFSPDGRILALERRQGLELWDAKAIRLLRTLDHKYISEHLAFSPDGRTLASAALEGIELWDVVSGRLLRTLPAPARDDPTDFADHSVEFLAFSPSGHVIASSGANHDGLKLWNVASGRLLRRLTTLHTLNGEVGLDSKLAISPDWRTLYVDVDSTLWEVSAQLWVD